MADISQVREITQRLEAGVKELFESDKYAEYLRTMSRFHRYSTRNTLLIYMARPDATRVAGYTTWKNEFKRQVKKGEHGIRILAPVPFNETKEFEKLDPDTKLPVLDENGQPVTETLMRMGARFKTVSVFDLAQTEGEALPTLAEDLTGDVARYDLFMDALRAVSPLPIVFENLPPDTDGTCHFGDRISIRAGMSEIQTVSAVVHELTHAKLHDLNVISENGEQRKDRRTEEVEAESVSYAVCQFYHIETGANSFGYLLEWSKSLELKELNASLDVIRKTTAELIDGIGEQYRALAKERGIDLSAAAEIGAEQNYNMIDGLVNNEAPQAEEPAPTPDESPYAALTAEYARNAEVSDPQRVGSNVLMTPVFDDGNLNRSGKKIRVTVEEPAGKYRLFSHDEYGEKALYFLTVSGMIDNLSEYFRSDWDGEQHKSVSHRPTEAELDEILPRIAERFEGDLANPIMWAKYQDAAVLNRLDECETHNAPLRKLRDEEREARREASEREQREKQHERQEKYDARVDEIADAILSGKTVSVGYDENEFDGRNPVLDLFKLYGVELPLRTQGWVNTGLAEITADGYRYYSSKHKGASTAFGGCLLKLREAIKATPIEQKRQRQTPENGKEEKMSIEQENYAKLAGLFPDFMSGKYSYLRLESKGFEPLSLEWVFGDRISVMHTYELNGDLCYDPMCEFIVNSGEKTLTASMFEQSIPPIYQYHDENGVGHSVDGNGNERVMPNLRGKINEFATGWFQNISEQGFMPVRANLVLGEDEEIRVAFDADGNMIPPGIEGEEDVTEPDAPKQTTLDLSLPDPTVTAADMNAYGYTYDGMLPMTAARAAELHDAGLCIYLLYPDNTEAMALDRDEIRLFDGFCGIETGDWRNSPIYRAQMTAAVGAENSREAGLLHDEPGMFGIYQVKDGIDEARDFRFAAMRELEAHGLTPDRANYELIYTAPLGIHDTQTNLHRIYGVFQHDSPECPPDFAGRSVSVSDVIVLQWRGEVSAHYVDRVGFKELPSFTGNEREQEPQTHGGPTVAELEADVKAGKSISMMDLSQAVNSERRPPAPKGRPSLMSRLDEAKTIAAAQNGQTAGKINKERGHE